MLDPCHSLAPALHTQPCMIASRSEQSTACLVSCLGCQYQWLSWLISHEMLLQAATEDAGSRQSSITGLARHSREAGSEPESKAAGAASARKPRGGDLGAML